MFTIIIVWNRLLEKGCRKRLLLKKIFDVKVISAFQTGSKSQISEICFGVSSVKVSNNICFRKQGHDTKVSVKPKV